MRRHPVPKRRPSQVTKAPPESLRADTSDPLKLTRSIIRRRNRGTALAKKARAKLFTEWIASTPWSALATKHAPTQFELVRVAAWLLTDEVTSTMSAAFATNRLELESFVDWILRVTKPDTAFFVERHGGSLANTFGRAHHRPGAMLAQAVEACAHALSIPIPGELRVPEMPFLQQSGVGVFYVGHSRDRSNASTEGVGCQPPGVWVLLSYINDWEAGSWHSEVAGTSIFTQQTEAIARFRSHQSALDAQADKELKKVRELEQFIAVGGFDVINVLLLIPFTHVTSTDPPRWDLGDNINYVVVDGSYRASYETGELDVLCETDHLDDLDLQDCLPEPTSAWELKRVTGGK